jgi:tetratricopeptide (TPR) repeat protein
MLGLAESRMSNYEIGKAENILKEANRIFLVKGNGDSPQFFKLMILRAKALDEQDQNEKALSLLAETLSTLLKTADFYGEEWVLAMQAMGEVLIQMGRTEDAELALLAAEDIAERLGGSLHPYLTETLALLAWIHCKENRLAQTRRFAVRLESLAESKLGPDHYMAGWAQYWLGTVHMRRGELETGERYLRAALARLAELPTKGGAFRRYAVGMIAEADEERNDFEEAEKGWLSLLPMIQKTRATQKQKELAYALSHLIRVYKKLGRPGEAAKYEKRLEAIEARSQSLKDTTDQSRPQERPVTPHNTRQRTQDPGNSLREDLHQSMPDQHNPIDSRITRFKVVGSPCDVPFAVNATDNAGGIAGVSYPTCKSIRRLKYGPSRHATPPIHRTQRSQENEGWEADHRYWPRDNDSEEEAGYFLRDVTTNGGVRLR